MFTKNIFQKKKERCYGKKKKKIGCQEAGFF